MTFCPSPSPAQALTARQAAKQARARQILDAARHTFAAKGFDKTNMEEIRAACGLSKGTLYLYFPSKEALFAAVAVVVFAELQAQCDQIVADRTRTAAARLQALFDLFGNILDAPEPGFGLYIDIFVQAWQTPAIRAALTEAYEPYALALAQLIGQGCEAGEFQVTDPNHTARGIIALLDGLALQRLMDTGKPLRPVLTEFTQTLLRGFGVAQQTATRPAVERQGHC